MSKLLINEPPLQVLPSLAKAIGINEAIVLQQIQYWVSKELHYYDNRYWTYNTITEWLDQFPHLSNSGLRKILNRLENLGLILTNNYNTNKFNHTKWYTINYKTLGNYVEKVNTDVLSDSSSELPSDSSSINTKTTLEYREILFRDKTKQHLTDYSLQMINDFCDYWTEPNASLSKMRFELQKTFDIKRRLRTWDKNSKKFGGGDKTGVVEI